jgi:hypothetical protein
LTSPPDFRSFYEDLARPANRKGLSDVLKSPLFTGDYLPLPKTALFGSMPWLSSLPRFSGVSGSS